MADNNESSKNMEKLTKALISKSYETFEIKSLKNYFLENEYSEGIKAFASGLSKDIIQAPNIALLRQAQALRNIFSGNMPKGLSSVINNMNTSTAKHLIKSENIYFDLNKKKFFDKKNPENTVNIAEANIIYSALDFFKEVKEEELIDFMNYISKYPGFASRHAIGERINDTISDWKEFIDFDSQLYYHARALKENQCPYTEQQMLKAPFGASPHGRFNYIGENHYYFSDELKGARNEIKKHRKKEDVIIQIAKIKPERHISMIDLSLDSDSKFLKYCRFSPKDDDYSNIKREYLIPCYVANCCKLHGIEGIKYYGSKEYNNYVAWSDDYFEFIEFEFYYKDNSIINVEITSAVT